MSWQLIPNFNWLFDVIASLRTIFPCWVLPLNFPSFLILSFWSLSFWSNFFVHHVHTIHSKCVCSFCKHVQCVCEQLYISHKGSRTRIFWMINIWKTNLFMKIIVDSKNFSGNNFLSKSIFWNYIDVSIPCFSRNIFICSTFRDLLANRLYAALAAHGANDVYKIKPRFYEDERGRDLADIMAEPRILFMLDSVNPRGVFHIFLPPFGRYFLLWSTVNEKRGTWCKRKISMF